MKTKAAFLVLIVFVLGFALGGLTMHLVEGRVFSHGPRGGGPNRFQQQITRDLGLTAEQQAQLAAILEDSRHRYNGIYEPIRPQLAAAREEGRNKIRAILTPEQLAQFNAIVQRIDEERGRKKRGN
ncbi:MAG TPA: hypothetical protein VGA40_09185 [Candidatus Acidoferrales bacterium]